MKVILPSFVSLTMIVMYVVCKELVQTQKRFMEHKQNSVKKLEKSSYQSRGIQTAIGVGVCQRMKRKNVSKIMELFINFSLNRG